MVSTVICHSRQPVFPNVRAPLQLNNSLRVLVLPGFLCSSLWELGLGESAKENPDAPNNTVVLNNKVHCLLPKIWALPAVMSCGSLPASRIRWEFPQSSGKPWGWMGDMRCRQQNQQVYAPGRIGVPFIVVLWITSLLHSFCQASFLQQYHLIRIVRMKKGSTSCSQKAP